MNAQTQVSIVIPAYKAAKTLSLALDSLKKISYPKKNLEIIIVDDGSCDETEKTVQNFAQDLNLRYLKQPHQGPACARNLGWQKSSYEIVYFVDADCAIDKDALTKMLPPLSFSEVAAVAGSYGIVTSEGLIHRCIHQEIIFRHNKMPQFIRAFGSYNVAIKKEVLQKLGGFDPDFSSASAEDNELSYRIIKSGYKIYFAKEAKVFHYHQVGLLGYLKIQLRHGFWRSLLYLKHPDMLKGDDYTRPKDALEPFLIAIFLMNLIVAFFSPGFFKLALITLLGYTLWQIAVALEIALKNKEADLLFLGVITFFRGFVRFFGAGWGIAYFLCRRTIKKNAKQIFFVA